jgi:multisubunit Na+/H+ antiporter MnhF subunit
LVLPIDMIGRTVIFAGLMIALGVVAFFGTGAHAYTALIPAGFGVLALVCAGVAHRWPRARKHAIHVAMLLALVGFAGTVKGVYETGLYLGGEPVKMPRAAESKAVMCLWCGVFLVTGIRSFVAARRAVAGGDVV